MLALLLLAAAAVAALPCPALAQQTIETASRSFTAVVPARISCEGMPAGFASAHEGYAVGARGAIAGGRSLTVSASAGPGLSGPMGAVLGLTVAQGRTAWSPADLYVLDATGVFVGTGSTDAVSVTGVANSSATYAGTVTYTATVG